MLLSVAGIMILINSRSRLWLLGSYFVAAGLFIVVASFPAGPVRMFITGVWYNDPPRLASLLPLVTLPLATIGAVACWDRLAVPTVEKLSLRVVQARVGRTTLGGSASTIVAAAVAGALLIVSTQQANLREAVNSAVPSYQLTDDSPLISTDELTLIDRIDSKVPEDAVIADNPWNGSALAYAFSGRRVLQPHMNGDMPPGAKKIIDELNEAAADPSICSDVKRLKVEYVLDFGHREVHGADHGYRGLDHLAQNGVARLIDSEGEAKLYELTACK
ncbi:hypothetical protein QFZ57_002418 [Arthrobacter sp. B1I2]|nr:hypothetical protein [Arthrobacter sp. B1I2]